VGYYRYVIGSSEGHDSSCFCQASTPRYLKEKNKFHKEKMGEVRTQTRMNIEDGKINIAHSHPVGGHQRISFREVF
jgi:hypothetical protein